MKAVNVYINLGVAVLKQTNFFLKSSLLIAINLCSYSLHADAYHGEHQHPAAQTGHYSGSQVDHPGGRPQMGHYGNPQVDPRREPPVRGVNSPRLANPHQGRIPNDVRMNQRSNNQHGHYFYKGNYYNYQHRGRYFNYFINGNYYNYSHNGKYFLFFVNGAYYNYFYNGTYYKTCREVPGYWEFGQWVPCSMVCE